MFAQKGMLVEGVQANTNKMRMVVALKLIVGRQELLMPKGVHGIWMHLVGWRMPDTKLRQDIASCRRPHRRKATRHQQAAGRVQR